MHREILQRKSSDSDSVNNRAQWLQDSAWARAVLAESDRARSRPVEIVKDLFEFRAIHMIISSLSFAHRRCATHGLRVAKFFKQNGPGPVQSRTHRANGASQSRSRLFVAHFFELAKDTTSR